MVYRIELSDTAAAEVESAVSYLASKSRQGAERWYRVEDLSPALGRWSTVPFGVHFPPKPDGWGAMCGNCYLESDSTSIAFCLLFRVRS